MRLLWVSRERFEQVCEFHRIQVQYTGDHARRVIEERARYDALLEKYHALKLQGAVAVEPQTPIARKEVDEVTQRINVLSAGKPGLRAQMLKQVQSDRLLNGLNDIEILQRIEAGVTTDDGVPV